MKIHPAAKLLPMMTPTEFDELVEDIRKHGQREHIWVHNSQIIDGRNRFKACRELGIDPKFREWDGEGDLVEFVTSMNVKRRHLNTGQRVFSALNILAHYEQQVAEGKEIFPSGQLRDHAGKLMGVSGRYVSDARRIRDEAPELEDKVLTADMSFAEARRIVFGKPSQKVNIWALPIHPANRIFPMMNSNELADLADSIRQNGQFQPIIIGEDESVLYIMDGKCRLEACRIAGVEPKWERWEVKSAVSLNVSLNLYRGHYTESERTMMATITMSMVNGYMDEVVKH